MTSVISAELQKEVFCETEAYNKVFQNNFMARPTLEKWVAKFFEVFSISMGSFYSAINTYGLLCDGVL